MEINKTNESFSLKDTTDAGWNVNGNVTSNADGSFYLNLNADSTDESGINTNIGYYNITIPTEGMYNINVTALPEYYSALTTYAETAIKTVQEYIKNQTSSEDK